MIASRITHAAAAAVIACAAFVSSSVAAPLKADPRIRYIVFNTNSVSRVPCALGISTMIQLGEDENIVSLSAGDTKGWSIVPKKKPANIIFVKPVAVDAHTNLNVVTDKRVYAIELVSEHSKGSIGAFQVRFQYPHDERMKDFEGEARRSISSPDLKRLATDRINSRYFYKGASSLKPLVAFDDGTKTFLQFRGEVPAIFSVGEDGHETPVNYRREEDYIVVDKIATQFTLRYGSRTVCLYNRGALPGRDQTDELKEPKALGHKARRKPLLVKVEP